MGVKAIKTLIDYKGQLVEAWLEVVDDSDPDYVLCYQDEVETYYNIDRRDVVQEYIEGQP